MQGTSLFEYFARTLFLKRYDFEDGSPKIVEWKVTLTSGCVTCAFLNRSPCKKDADKVNKNAIFSDAKGNCYLHKYFGCIGTTWTKEHIYGKRAYYSYDKAPFIIYRDNRVGKIQLQFF